MLVTDWYGVILGAALLTAFGFWNYGTKADREYRDSPLFIGGFVLWLVAAVNSASLDHLISCTDGKTGNCVYTYTGDWVFAWPFYALAMLNLLFFFAALIMAFETKKPLA